MLYSCFEIGVKFDALPFVTPISSKAKPSTGSSKVIVTSNGPPTGSDASVVISTVGRVSSTSMVRGSAARLPLPTSSSAISSATDTVTSPVSSGVMMAVYSCFEIGVKFDALPFDPVGVGACPTCSIRVSISA